MASGKKNARRRKASIFFEDESGVSQRPSVRRTWAPKRRNTGPDSRLQLVEDVDCCRSRLSVGRASRPSVFSDSPRQLQLGESDYLSEGASPRAARPESGSGMGRAARPQESAHAGLSTAAAPLAPRGKATGLRPRS